eukprot:COSAG01_NODE_53_length_31352_cov_23.122452_28_plen_60_part_00
MGAGGDDLALRVTCRQETGVAIQEAEQFFAESTGQTVQAAEKEANMLSWALGACLVGSD